MFILERTERHLDGSDRNRSFGTLSRTVLEKYFIKNMFMLLEEIIIPATTSKLFTTVYSKCLIIKTILLQ